MPGDIIIVVPSGHTWVYTGNRIMRTRFPNSNSSCVEASIAHNDWKGYFPHAHSMYYPIDNGDERNFHVFRNIKLQKNSKYAYIKIE